MRNNWARSSGGTRAVVKILKTRVTSHTVIGPIHSSALLHDVLKKPTLKSATEITTEKKKAVAEANDDEAVLKNDASVIDVKSTPKGTTPAPFIKFINELLDIMDEDGNLKGSYLRMDNASIHISKPMIRKIEARGYRVMNSPFIRLS